MATKGSFPTIHASWPGGIEPTSPGPNSPSDPSSIRTPIRPEMTWMRWATWQLWVPTIGLTHSEPAPSWFKGRAHRRHTTQVHDLRFALFHGSHFFRRIKALLHIFAMFHLQVASFTNWNKFMRRFHIGEVARKQVDLLLRIACSKPGAVRWRVFGGERSLLHNRTRTKGTTEGR